MTLKTIGFIIKVLKLAYETFVEKPVKVRPVRMPRPMRQLWMVAAAALGFAAIIVILRWFFRPLDLPPGTTGMAPHLPPEKRKPEIMPVSTHEPVELKAGDNLSADQPDDLALLSGIGQKTAQILSNSGYTTFKRIAASTPEELAAVLKQAGLRIVNPATWPEQAAFAAKGDWAGLKAYLAGLKNSES